jgi:hypothetical protein
MKRTEAIVVLLALVVFGVGLLTQIPGERFSWKADARFRLQLRSNDAHYPFFFQRQSQAISNVLLDPVCARRLANAAGVKESDFKLVGIGPIRGTSLVYVRYAGTDRDSVERVASNSLVMLEKFYFTNQPGLDVEYLDTVPIKRVPFSQKVRDEIDDRLPH